MAPKPMPHSAAQNSIRMQLILIPSCILALGIAVVIGVTLYGAKSRIASEISSGLTLGDHLIRYALDDLADSPASDAAAEASAISRLREGLAHVRHIKVSFVSDPADADPGEPVSAPTRDAAPAWFESLLRPATITKTYPVTIGGEPHGEILMGSEPADEIAEIWTSLLFLTTLLTVLSIAIVALIILAARHTLEPLRQLVEGLDRLGRGQFGVVGDIKIAELSRIGEHFNKLSATLARAEADNHLLIDQLLSIQDSERKELARELHDEFGASLFGIRVAASCIVEAAAAGTQAEKDEIIDRAKNISALADAIQKQNYRILERIRPVVLRQMGLADALRQLVEAFAAQHRDFSCAIDIVGAEAERRFDEEASLTAYRIVQECLTNVARHSGASAVSVAMTVETAGAAGPYIRLVIADDGIGPPPELRYGFGLLGMSERARKLDGRLAIEKGASGGMRITAIIPVAGPRPAVKASETSLFETNSPAGGEPAEGAAIHS